PDAELGDPGALPEAVRRPPLIQLSLTNQAGLLTTFARALAVSQGRAREAAMVMLEGWLESPLPEFATAPRFREVPLSTQAGFVRSWLLAAGPFHPQALRVSEAFLAHVIAVRNRLSYRERRDYIEIIRQAGTDLQHIALSLAERARQ